MKTVSIEASQQDLIKNLPADPVYSKMRRR